MENPLIELELRKLGLTEKEVRVYLAGLELGPSPVQKIAELIKIARPTTYEMIKKLEEKGLFVEAKQRNKRLFSAQSPENILGVLRTKKREIEEKEREFIRIIATLEAKYSKEEKIKAFKGKEGLEAVKEMISFSPTQEITVINPKNNPLTQKEMKEICQAIKRRLGKLEVKEINLNRFNGTLIIFNKIVYFPFKKQEALLIG